MSLNVNLSMSHVASLDSFFFFFWGGGGGGSVKRPFQDYFTHIETSQSVGGAKREYPGKTT